MTQSVQARPRVAAGRAALLFLLVTAVTAVAAGCAAAPPGHLAPPITLDQLDVGPYGGAPCTLLRADRAARRHLTAPGTPVTDAATGGPGCRWAPAGPRYPTVTAGASTIVGLEDVYRGRAHDTAFTPIHIAHYPAVELSTVPGGIRAGRCTVQIGVADHSTIAVTADYPPFTDSAFASDPCGDADTLATEIMGQLLAGSP